MAQEFNIYHLYHSGVVVEAGARLFIFDYYRDRRKEKINEIFPKFEEYNKIYVFASHGHPDHFHDQIFNWIEINSSIEYILSSDIGAVRDSLRIRKMGPDKVINIGEIEVKTLGSTDQGVSFLVQTEEFNMFHSGDLNWWHWESFSREELKKEEQDYKNEVDKLQGRELKIAFVPVDPRLGEYYYLAGEYFAQTIKPEILVPLHFGDEYDITDRFKEKISDLPVMVTEIGPEERLIYTGQAGDESGE